MSSTVNRPEETGCNSACGCDVEEKPLTKRQIIGLKRANRARNAEFRKATRAQKRVMIAKDILSALRRGKIVANQGVYVEPSYDYEGPNLDDAAQEAPADASLQELLETVAPCQVCAKGAIFLCTVAMRNKVTVGEFNEMNGNVQNDGWSEARKLWRGENLSKTLGGLFSPKQLAMIENEFEDDVVDSLGGNPIMRLSDLEDDDARLRKIFRNVVRNNGTFVPKRAPEPKDDSYGFYGH